MPEQTAVTLMQDAQKMNGLAQSAREAGDDTVSAIFSLASTVASTGAALWWKLHTIQEQMPVKKSDRWFFG